MHLTVIIWEIAAMHGVFMERNASYQLVRWSDWLLLPEEMQKLNVRIELLWFFPNKTLLCLIISYSLTDREPRVFRYCLTIAVVLLGPWVNSFQNSFITVFIHSFITIHYSACSLSQPNMQNNFTSIANVNYVEF